MSDEQRHQLLLLASCQGTWDGEKWSGMGKRADLRADELQVGVDARALGAVCWVAKSEELGPAVSGPRDGIGCVCVDMRRWRGQVGGGLEVSARRGRRRRRTETGQISE